MSSKRNSSFIFGLILVLIGVLFLLDNVGVYINVWYYLGKYWPVILILIGLNQVFRYKKKDE